MPYDKAERTWKIRILGPNGRSEGLFEPGYFRTSRHGDEEFHQYEWLRTWPGKPQDAYTEVLDQEKCQDGDANAKPSYLLLYRFDDDDFTDRDYGRSRTRQQAAQWLMREEYRLPDDLNEFIDSSNPASDAKEDLQNLPLTEALEEVWNLLDGQILAAKDLAKLVSAAPVSTGSMRKRIEAIRKTGRKIVTVRGAGYYRPDAPPKKS